MVKILKMENTVFKLIDW